jgi:tripartite-type tricarboxylate transporter receptor subunit TctC
MPTVNRNIFYKGITMIKHLIVAVLMLASLSVAASEKITIVWGFSPASNQANVYRAIVQELNRTQSKYEFVYETKTGAGGAIAARHVLENPQNTLIGGTSSFFVRQNFDQATGYQADQFQPVFVQALGAPLALFSTNFKNITQLKQSKSITTSISGYGSHSNLMASILSETYPQTVIVNYPSLLSANKDVVGQHIDTGWNWLSDIEQLAESNLTTILGLTGIRTVKGYVTLSSLGIKGYENVSTNTAIYAGFQMPAEKVKEIYNMLRVANRSLAVRNLYAKEYSTPADFNWEQTQKWYKDQVKFWSAQSAKVKSLSN